jgi:hypothetical protein
VVDSTSSGEKRYRMVATSGGGPRSLGPAYFHEAAENRTRPNGNRTVGRCCQVKLDH